MTTRNANPLHFLTISWSVSRGRDTYGYNICRLDCDILNKRFRTCGGGYDMIGTVLADWFTEAYQPELQKLFKDNAKDLQEYAKTMQRLPQFYGAFMRENGTVYLDGGCGVSSIIRIIEACGFDEVETKVNKKGHVIGYFVQKSAEVK